MVVAGLKKRYARSGLIVSIKGVLSTYLLKSVRRTTTRPKLEASKELYSLGKQLLRVKTQAKPWPGWPTTRPGTSTGAGF